MALLLLLLIALAYAQDADTPFGDVKITCPPSDAATTRGAVSVYYPEHGYVPVCLDGFNRGAAAAVCRQLGYVDAIPIGDAGHFFGSPFDARCKEPTETYNMYIRMRCPEVSNYAVDGELHSMRCSITNLTTTECAENVVAAVECSSESLKDSDEYRYNGQVRLAHEAHTSSFKGIAEIIISNDVYPLCYDTLTHFMANSICRQLGYTNSKIPERTLSDRSKRTVNLRTDNCSKSIGSYPCFSHCIKIDDYIDTNCATVKITCDFINENMTMESSGSHGQCELSIPSPPDVIAEGGVGIGIGIGIAIGTFLTVLSLVIVWIVYKKTCERQPQPQPQPQPPPEELVNEAAEQHPLLNNGDNMQEQP